MKIFFTTPYDGKVRYQNAIDEIIKVVENAGVVIVSPEKSRQYDAVLNEKKNKELGGNRDRAHYEFILRGIAEADAVIFEASYEDFRVGHEATLALMYDKPVLVLSQLQDYSRYISHERLTGKKYKSISELKQIVDEFIQLVRKQIDKDIFQTVDEVVDLKHSAKLSKLRYKALQGQSYFADWARRASSEADKVYEEILDKLGNLKVQKPWDAFAKIYNEDTPDSVFYGAIKFVDKILKQNGVGRTDLVVDAACGTGAVSRILTSFGYKQITAFDRSRAMLSEAFRLCSHMPSIKIMEAEIEEVSLESAPKAMVWIDFSSNFALSKDELIKWLNNLLANLTGGGVLLFDVRTRTGWEVDFFKQKVTAYETENFQRLWINLPDYEKGLITFDIFIRVKDRGGEWLPWEREQMTERMWGLSEVKEIVQKLTGVSLVGIYGDDFVQLTDVSAEPGLAYLLLQRK